jgi:ceramide glucosyltransferase
MLLIHPVLATVGLVSLTLATGYAVLTLVAVLTWQFRRASPPAAPQLPAVTVLKPLCGAEPGLYDDLRSFCLQNHPQFQIVFGVRDPADPALAVVEQLVAEFPLLPIDVVIDPRLHGSNLKISNLINMMARARHDVLAIADSDTRVGSDYLATVTRPLVDRNVGLVTCIYHGVPTHKIWSRLGAMYSNEWYIPSVLLTWLFGYEGYVSGQTICMSRATLQAIGGLRAVTNHVADDYRLGELVRGLGLRVVFSPYVLSGKHHEPTLDSLTKHELRWMRTLRVLRPSSFSLLFLTFSLPLGILGRVLTADEPLFSTAGLIAFHTAVIARLALHFWHRWRVDRPLFADLWLLPARDLLTCYVWCRSFLTSRVTWRGTEFEVGPDGVMRWAGPCAETSALATSVRQGKA